MGTQQEGVERPSKVTKCQAGPSLLSQVVYILLQHDQCEELSGKMADGGKSPWIWTPHCNQNHCHSHTHPPSTPAPKVPHWIPILSRIRTKCQHGPHHIPLSGPSSWTPSSHHSAGQFRLQHCGETSLLQISVQPHLFKEAFPASQGRSFPLLDYLRDLCSFLTKHTLLVWLHS